MASAFSTPRQYAPYQEQFNKELLAKALQYKQGKYDLNKEKIQQTVQNITGLDLMRPQDAEYLNNKLQNVLNVVNQYGVGDLSLDSNTDYIKSSIANIADDKVMAGYLGTMSVRNIQKEAEEARKDGKFVQKNYDYSMRDAQAWMANPEVGASYKGGKNYVPYTDLNMKFMEQLKYIEPTAYSEISANGQYTFFKENRTEIDPAVIKSAFSLMLDSDAGAAQQLQVNSWDNYRNLSDQEFGQKFQQDFDVLTKSYNNSILALKREIANTDPNDPEYQRLNALLKHTEDNAAQFETAAIAQYRPQIELAYYKENLLNNYAKTFAGVRQKDISLISDSEGLSKMKLGITAIQEFNQIKYTEKNDAKARQHLETFRPYMSLIDGKYGVNSYETLAATSALPEVQVTPINVEEQPEVVFDSLKADAANKLTQVNKNIALAYQSLSNEDRKLYFLEGNVPNYEAMANNLRSDNSFITGKKRQDLLDSLDEVEGQILTINNIDKAVQQEPINNTNTWIQEVTSKNLDGSSISLGNNRTITYSNNSFLLSEPIVVSSPLQGGRTEIVSRPINQSDVLNLIVNTATPSVKTTETIFGSSLVEQPFTDITFNLLGSDTQISTLNQPKFKQTMAQVLKEQLSPTFLTGQSYVLSDAGNADVNQLFKDFIDAALASGVGTEQLQGFGNLENFETALSNFYEKKSGYFKQKEPLKLDYDNVTNSVILRGIGDPISLSLGQIKPNSSLFNNLSQIKAGADQTQKYKNLESKELSKIAPSGGNTTKNLQQLSYTRPDNNSIKLVPKIKTVSFEGSNYFTIEFDRKFVGADGNVVTEQLSPSDLNKLLNINYLIDEYNSYQAVDIEINRLLGNEAYVKKLLQINQ